MPRPGGSDPAFGFVPAHHRRSWSKTPFQNFIPSNNSSALGGHEFVDPPDEITLQFVFILETFGLDAGLTIGARLPPILRAFIAADVDEGARKQVHYFGQHILNKFKSMFLTRAINV